MFILRKMVMRDKKNITAKRSFYFLNFSAFYATLLYLEGKNLNCIYFSKYV